MDWILRYLQTLRDVTAEMAPYLLLGFAVAGVLSGWLTRSFVQRHLGGGRLASVFRATLVGVPMPLCSCGVLPVAASLRERGASRGATTAFLTSTPQTGVDSIAATFALLGPIFTGVRVVAAFVTGWLNGLFVEWLGSEPKDRVQPKSANGCCSMEPADSGCADETQPVKSSNARSVSEMARYGWITMPREIGRALLFGLLLAALIVQLIPEGDLTRIAGQGLLSLVLITALSVPFYVCSTASIPVGLALLHAGVSPGAVLVFLITGPATNAATITTLWTTLGRRSTIVYISGLVLSAWLFGWIFNQFYAGTLDAANHAHDSLLPGWLGDASAVLLLLLLAFVLIPWRDLGMKAGVLKPSEHAS
ncbi:MAG: SO_0444 family Cu/Zn efflux transporter [Opitutales bacterium]